jgi:hypothetical protein
VKDQLFWLVDIDGTLALRDELRGPFDWHLVMGDRPNQPVVDVVVALSQAGFQIIYISGRPDSTMEVTSKWLDENVGVAGLIFMRSENDYRSDDIVKAEIFENKIFQRFANVERKIWPYLSASGGRKLLIKELPNTEEFSPRNHRKLEFGLAKI